MNQKLIDQIEAFDYSTISESRKRILQEVVKYVQAKSDQNARINLNCICTHNSRRSQFTQVWSKVAGMYFRVRKVNSYSGGTEATAVHPSVLKTLEYQGFSRIELPSDTNAIHALRYDEYAPPILLFSKKYDHPFNPSREFGALMTCDHADQNCPVVEGADMRFSLPFIDPKVADNTPDEAKMYLGTSVQIATEMFYLFDKIKKDTPQ